MKIDDDDDRYVSSLDHGTSHCSIIDSVGNAVAATSTVNTE